MGIISFNIDDLHFNLGVKMLNDRFGIQMRGGCTCAGTYGHSLFGIDEQVSEKITDEVEQGIFTSKPGWIRCSIHPTMTTKEVHFIADSILELAANHKEWSVDYIYDTTTNEYNYKHQEESISVKVNEIFNSI